MEFGRAGWFSPRRSARYYWCTVGPSLGAYIPKNGVTVALSEASAFISTLSVAGLLISWG